jgi:hypothetical protein
VAGVGGDVNFAEQTVDEKEASDYVSLLRETRAVSCTIPDSRRVIAHVVDTAGIGQILKSIVFRI